jgi:hypothetical protein
VWVVAGLVNAFGFLGLVEVELGELVREVFGVVDRGADGAGVPVGADVAVSCDVAIRGSVAVLEEMASRVCFEICDWGKS